ncbi:endonuclease/exonuclease/phosphatase family protein [Rasiella sp. SM2506]|uniref:endonuclease/exonuclease/phosphatase family protein n=1 Tax=Rasiella sp. SM2506 TaxID=3423914 RepID=UPI003D7BBAB7
MSTSEERYYCFAFYNLENLFDTEDDPKTLDDNFTKNSSMRWNEKRFRKKIRKLGSIIQQIGYNDINFPPVLVGVAEVENRYVLEQLVASKFLQQKNYGILHFDSPDERGIDTGLLYRKDYVTVVGQQAHQVLIENEHGDRDYTRDILSAHLEIEGHSFYVLVNHWPSRRAGEALTAPRRLAAAKKNVELVEALKAKNPQARIIIMGDFNDDPKSESIQHLVTNGFYNPMELLLTHETGSTSYRGAWNLFDQILVSHNFMRQHENPFQFDGATVFNMKYLTEYKGRNKGNPFRTYLGKKYTGGFSDHFPIYGKFLLKS